MLIRYAVRRKQRYQLAKYKGRDENGKICWEVMGIGEDITDRQQQHKSY